MCGGGTSSDVRVFGLLKVGVKQAYCHMNWIQTMLLYWQYSCNYGKSPTNNVKMPYLTGTYDFSLWKKKCFIFTLSWLRDQFKTASVGETKAVETHFYRWSGWKSHSLCTSSRLDQRHCPLAQRTVMEAGPVLTSSETRLKFSSWKSGREMRGRR